jgi:CheY-like chemotaxis protein
LTVLVVDDDDITRRLIARGLPKAGGDTREAENAEAASDLLRTDRSITLVIMDVMMPGTDGLNMVKPLRRTPPSRLPVLICSALGTPGAVARAAGIGAR